MGWLSLFALGYSAPVQTETIPYSPEAIEQAAELIAAGEAVAVPTETVYGLAGDATNAAAVARIYEAKGRPSFNPLIVHVPDIEAAKALAKFNDTALALAEQYWPGPLTLVLPRREDCPVASLATAGLPSIAIRVPAHRAMQALLKACDRPLAAPSANASGSISATQAAHVAASLGGRIPMILDDGPCERGLESTIIALTDDTPRLLRPGPIMAEELCLASTVPAATIEAPGQLESHYAPSKPLRLNASEAEANEWLIGFGAIAGDDTLSPSGDLIEAASRLFDSLHRADASPKPLIAIAPVPDTGLGLAINDRLRRAAA